MKHLHDTTIDKEYRCEIDCTGQNLIGYSIQCNYERGYVDIRMPTYIKDAIKRLLCKVCMIPQYSPHEHVGVRWKNRELPIPK